MIYPPIQRAELRLPDKAADWRPPTTYNGVWETVREGYKPMQPGIIPANREASLALLWLRAQVKAASKRRAYDDDDGA